MVNRTIPPIHAVLGIIEDARRLPSQGELGDAWYEESKGRLWIWDDRNSRWVDISLWRAGNTAVAGVAGNGVMSAPGPQAGPQAGPQGEPGVAGPQGEPGVAGSLGPVGPAGKDGAPGADGAPGRNGLDGKQGPGGAAGKDGKAGPAGPPGPQGKSGLDGIDGVNGLNGINGKDGKDGKPGPVGPPGKNGIAGPAGPKGERGVAGPAGAPGKQGLVGSKGVDGKNGKDGKNGVAGPAGPKGERGVAGPKGDAGLMGPAGPATGLRSSGARDITASLRLPPGAKIDNAVLRRVGDTVQLSLTGLRSTRRLKALLGKVPAGFRPHHPHSHVTADEAFRQLRVSVEAGSANVTVNQPAAADGLDKVSTTLVWLSDDAWPATLPGRPARR